MAVLPTVPRIARSGASKPTLTFSAGTAGERLAVRRRIDPGAGRALEVLGHAIDYLTDEYINSGGQFRVGDTELEAIDLLINANRAIYFDCPAVPTFRQRCLRFFGIGRR
jgi:hypothetical protein